jgi:hypothetical protein
MSWRSIASKHSLRNLYNTIAVSLSRKGATAFNYEQPAKEVLAHKTTANLNVSLSPDMTNGVTASH